MSNVEKCIRKYSNLSSKVDTSKQILLKISGKLCTPMFLAALSTITKGWKQPKCPPMLVHTYKRISFSHRRKNILTHATSTDEP